MSTQLLDYESRQHPMVVIEVERRRYGWASIWPEDIDEIVCRRVKDHAEQYLVRWRGILQKDYDAYSWHTVHELSDGQRSGHNALHLLQDYVESTRSLKRVAGVKRKSPEDEEQPHANSAVDRLATESSRSSPASDTSVDSFVRDDDIHVDCYNCSLVIKDDRITIKYIPEQVSTKLFPTTNMLLRSHRVPTEAADKAIRTEFDQRLSRIPGRKPIRHVNSRDSSTPSLHFRFVDTNVYGEGVEPPNPEHMIGCTKCKPNMGRFCGCEYPKDCECLEYARVDEEKLTNEERVRYDKAKRQGGSTMGLPKNFPYAKETGLLVQAYLDHRYPIYECNDRCKCGKNCKTKVVQWGRKVGLEIFKTKTRGWGLRSTEALLKGQFVDVYRGEVITNEEADRRQEQAEKTKESYLFSLDKFEDIVKPLYLVDGEFMGGPARFINHSCDSNCAQYAVCYDRNNPYIYDIAIFAIRDIPAGVELTFDYLDVDLDDDGSKEDLEKRLRKEVEADSVPCKCRAKNCRRWLWK